MLAKIIQQEYRFYNFIEKLQVEFKQNIYNGEFDPGSG
jgi:hypothetical protein